jgi:sterol desaturase/sphingolipid hydroxylase (fatty acid hydroxylase superfamily)
MNAAAALAGSIAAMAAIITVRYFAASGLFAWLTGRRLPGLYRPRTAQIRREVGWSLLSALVYAAPAGVVAWGWQRQGWTQIYTDADAWPIWWIPASVLVYLAAHDAWFYWTHRWMHRPRPFRIAHAVHHASRPPTAWAAMSFHPIEAATGAIVIPALVMIVPIHYTALAIVLAIMTVMGVTNHMGWEIFPDRLVRGPLGGWLITASHHHRHHQEYRCNYGLYFRFWDRLCSTDRGIGDPCGDRRRDAAASAGS